MHFVKKVVYKPLVLCYNDHVSNNMTHLQTLKTDLEIHIKSRAALQDGSGGIYIKRAGYDVGAVIYSYDTIIQSLQKEIASIESKKRKKKTLA